MKCEGEQFVKVVHRALVFAGVFGPLCLSIPSPRLAIHRPSLTPHSLLR